MVWVDDVPEGLPQVTALYLRTVASLGDGPIDVQRDRELLHRLLGETPARREGRGHLRMAAQVRLFSPNQAREAGVVEGKP